MKQTFLALIKDANGKTITFERFSCKRPETVRANMEKVLANDLYRVCIGKEAAAVEIYKTDYTVTENQQPVITFTIK